MSEDKNLKIFKRYCPYILGAIFIWILPLVLGIFKLGDSNSIEAIYQALSVLVSAIAFIALVISIKIQNKDLELQRHELALQREELKMTRNVLDDQAETMELQRFETTFFNLMNQLSLARQNASYGENTRRAQNNPFEVEFLSHKTGYNAFQEAREKIRDIKLDSFKGQLNSYFYQLRFFFGHYFELSHSIIRFIDNKYASGEITELQAIEYVRFYKSTLSYQEIAVLAYYSITELGSSFKKYFDKYKIFEDNRNNILVSKSHEEYFSNLKTT